MYNIEFEVTAIEAYTTTTGEKVNKCGLFIDINHCYLGASPDGVTESGGIVEVKCPITAEFMTIEQATETLKTFCIDKRTKKLKRSHNYWFQIQGQLHVSGKNFCDFIIWTKKDLYVERIYPNETCWNKMLPKLKFCFEKAMLPEIIDPRKQRSMPLREPE